MNNTVDDRDQRREQDRAAQTAALPPEQKAFCQQYQHGNALHAEHKAQSEPFVAVSVEQKGPAIEKH